ncbi:MAG: DUF3426 domain-containing protein [Lysobacter sp.]|nr:DUF3426 domain-containing protein [Lysobacter sp.]
MFVPCPHCGFSLSLTDAEACAPQRCPRCEGALAASATTTPQEGIGIVAGPDVDQGPTGPASDGEPADPLATLMATHASPAADGSPASVSSPKVAAARPRRGRTGTPSFVRNPHPAIPLGPRWPGLLTIAVLALALTTQLLLIERDALAGSERWRPAITGVCAVLRCKLPPWREPTAISMLDRSVQPQPGRPGVLAVQASFRNDASWSQPWPELLLSLSDINGRAVAQGAFAPVQYGASADPAALLAPGQAASIRFAVREPDPRTVAFSFEFR